MAIFSNDLAYAWIDYLMGVLGYPMGVVEHIRTSKGRSRISNGLVAAPGNGQVALGTKKVVRA